MSIKDKPELYAQSQTEAFRAKAFYCEILAASFFVFSGVFFWITLITFFDPGSLPAAFVCLGVLLLCLAVSIVSLLKCLNYHRISRRFRAAYRAQECSLQVASAALLKETAFGIRRVDAATLGKVNEKGSMQGPLVGVEITDTQGERYLYYFPTPEMDAEWMRQSIRERLRATMTVQIFAGTHLICAFDPPLL